MAYCVFCGAAESKSFCTNCGAEQPGSKKRARRPKPQKKFLAIAGVVVLVIGFAMQQAVTRLVLPYSGPLLVDIESVPLSNTLVGSIYTVSLNGTGLTIPRGAGSQKLDLIWSTESPIELVISSKVIGEEDLLLTYDPRSEGAFGIDPDSTIKLDVFFGPAEFEAALSIADSESESAWRIVASDSSKRRNVADLVSKCVAKNEAELAPAVEFASGAYDNYNAAMRTAELDGIRDLYYRTWAARAARLVGLIENQIDKAPGYNGDLSKTEWNGLLGSYQEVADSWTGLEEVSLAEDDSSWDSAWDRIRDAESGLESRARLFSDRASDAKQLCLANLYKN